MNNKTAAQKTNFAQRAIESRKAVLQDEHQLEFVCEINGVAFINDAISTSISRTRFSIECIDAPILLITGGADMQTDYSSLTPLMNNKVVGIIYLGNHPEDILRFIRVETTMFFTAKTQEEAVNLALKNGQMGDAVLYSPGCPSNALDTFKNRGNEFKKIVNSVNEAA